MIVDTEKHIYSLLNTDLSLGTLLTGGLGIVYQFPQTKFFTPAVSYFEENQSDRDYADNEPYTVDSSIRIDIATRQDQKAKMQLIASRIDTLMSGDGWARTYSQNIGADEMGIQHRIMIYIRAISKNDNI